MRARSVRNEKQQPTLICIVLKLDVKKIFTGSTTPALAKIFDEANADARAICLR